ncbi:helix-turn-helix domain-containing protein [Emticicia sp. 21SJ11W-3]|uniref:helix-turn-helix domain-containing protein n=1 Tax=Emticicia sp. 21SJ11W-3 TaxID=2916755 RepID=UPI00209D9A8E|nr:helix-turn-helix domain-containing protein [Emticicia sp. 21SJ11W-3]UTA68346.1 helix-turn-helix domain-containing protein [Emticicia sp. 21SJ11W-3]
MKVCLYPICSDLQPYVKAICSIESDTTDTILAPLRILPDACVEVFFNFSNSGDTHATVTGKKEFHNSRSFVVSRVGNFMDVQMKSKTGFISVCFYPSTAYLFFQLPMSAIADSLTDLQFLWGTVVQTIEDEIDNATSCMQKVGIIQKYLIRQLKANKQDTTLEYCLQQIACAQSMLTVAALAEKAGLSQRQLSRRFNYCIGLSTKEYIRISRFINSLAYLKKYPESNLTDAAYASGYYDQAHFIHDYKTFAGITPKAVLLDTNIIC